MYLLVSALEHNGEGAVANQVLPAELKLPDGLHGSLVNCCCCCCCGSKWSEAKVKQLQSDLHAAGDPHATGKKWNPRSW